MPELLIDDRGVVWPGLSHRITSGHDYREATIYVLSALGFVHIRMTRSAMRVSFDPRRMTLPAMISAFFTISENQPERVMLSYGDDFGNDELHGRINVALARIEELVATPPSCERVITDARRRSLDRLPRQFDQQLASLMHAANEGQWSPERYENFRASGLLDNAVVVRKPGPGDQLIVDHWGADRNPYVSPVWIRIARGKDVEDQPLIQLGAKVAVDYRAMIADGQPRFHDIDFLVVSPSGQPSRQRYARLLLPLPSSGREKFAMNWIFPVTSRRSS